VGNTPYRDYPQRWDDLAAIFARQAVLKGSFDQYAESNKAKKGTAEVDAAFLQEIERWRDLLARNIALRNPGLSQRELNYAVQATIDRIIFLRIGEDRGIEPYGRLMALQNGSQVYQRLGQLFRLADDRYNSGLFHFKAEKGRESPDEWTLNLALDDKVLKDILKNLYYPDSPYEFSVLPADLLGQVYEQFLGKVIRLTSGHRALVEDKLEVKKAGGVYYTPTYIVDYIVRQTVGRLLGDVEPGFRVEGLGSESNSQNPKPQTLTPKDIHSLRILDPACGSGSFLIGAYQYLLDWYLRYYTSHEPEKWAKKKNPPLRQVAALAPLPPGSQPTFQLTTAERKRILLEHIFGVDIDPQAVEVTKLSLLLKVLEGESEHSLATQLSFFQERALPDLSHNIKCGNSLIGPDFLLESTYLKPALRGRSIDRYSISGDLLLIVPYEIIDSKVKLISEEIFAQSAPKTFEYLKKCKPRLDQRENGRFKREGWYQYGRPQNLHRFEISEKIVFPDVVSQGTCFIDTKGMWLLDTVYGISKKSEIELNLHYLLGILNSPILTQFLKETGTTLRGGYFRMKTAYLEPFPIRTIDFTNPTDQAYHDQMVALVERMLALQRQLAAVKTGHDQTAIQRQIAATGRQIDRLVYQLYDLTEAEIKIYPTHFKFSVADASLCVSGRHRDAVLRKF
jgi:hypothetical protein